MIQIDLQYLVVLLVKQLRHEPLASCQLHKVRHASVEVVLWASDVQVRGPSREELADGVLNQNLVLGF